METIPIEGMPIWATVLIAILTLIGGIVTTWIVNVGSKKAGLYKRKYEELLDDNIETRHINNLLKEENIKLKVENSYHEKALKSFIRMEMISNPERAETLKIWLDE